MPAGLASLREGRLVDQIDGYVQQGNIEGANRLGQRWVNALSKHQIGREPLFGDLDDTKGWHGLTPDNREQIEAWRSKWERNTKRRSGQAGLQPEEVSIAAKHNLEIFLIISGWLRWGHAGEPGLCFYGGDALTDFLNLLFDRGVNELACDTIRKTLLRLGLKKAAPHHPRVLEVRRVNGTGLIKIELRRPRGSVWNTLDAKQGLKICDRQLYPIPRPA